MEEILNDVLFSAFGIRTIVIIGNRESIYLESTKLTELP